MNKVITLFIIILSLFISTEVFAQVDTFNTQRAPFKKLYFRPDPSSFNVSLFRSANSYRTGIRDFVLPIVDKTMLPGSFVIPISILLYGRASEKPYEEQTGFLMSTALFTNSILTFAMKMTFNVKRPYVTLSNVFYEGDAGFDVYSFPSGHASTSFTVSTMMALRYPEHPQYYLPFFAWATTIAYGRMYLGMHYPIDLTIGALIGVVSATATYAFRKQILEFRNYLFNESKPDSNSKQKNIDLLVASVSLISSALINELQPKIGKGKLFVSPNINSDKMQMNLNYQF